MEDKSVIVKRLQGLPKFSAICPVRAYDPEGGFFFCDSKYIGFGFICVPLPGSTGKEHQQIQTVLSKNYPPGSIIQFDLIPTPYIVIKINEMEKMRGQCKNEGLKQAIKKRADYLFKSTDTPMRGTGTLTRDCILMVTVKIPVKDNYDITSEEHSMLTEFRDAFQTTLEVSGLRPERLTRELYIRIINSLFCQGKDAVWHDRQMLPVRDDELISDQLKDQNRTFFVNSDYVGFGDPADADIPGEYPTGTTFIRTSSCKKYPKMFFPGEAVRYLGDIFSGSTGIKNPCIISLSMIFPSQQKTRGNFQKKRMWVVQQTQGPLLKWIPSLATIREGYDILNDKVDNGDVLLKTKMTITSFSNSKEGLNKAVQEVNTYFESLNFRFLPDKNFVAPIFLSSVPLFNEAAAETDLGRTKTFSVTEAMAFAPLYADWQGTRTPALMLTSRTGQIQKLDLFDSDTNFNAVIAAESGSGKSFLTNYIITSYLSLGAQVWCIDVGDSYKNICENYDGDYMDFSPEKPLCLNFFELIEDYFGEKDSEGSGEEDLVIGLLSVMAAPKEKLSDFQTARLKSHVGALIREHGKATTVDMVADSCLADDDVRVRDLGHQLFSFTSKGQYGKYFVGKNTVDFKNPFTVLELSRIESSEHLKQVVLLQLIYQIQQTMFLGDRGRLKIVIIDEAWALMTGNIGAFIEKGYRRFRKYRGAAITITQSITDIYRDDIGKAVADNSSFMFLLGQSASTISEAQKNNRLPLSEGGYDLLRSVSTIKGVYSEIFVLSKSGQGICRLVVDPFSLLLYSTDPKDVSDIRQLRKQGMTTEQAIINILQERGIY